MESDISHSGNMQDSGQCLIIFNFQEDLSADTTLTGAAEYVLRVMTILTHCFKISVVSLELMTLLPELFFF